MRIRSTKPEFYRSKTIAAYSWSDRFVLKALESYVDDNGVGKDDLTLIAADAFPRDLSARAPETLANLSEALHRFSEGNLIVRYEVAGEPLLYIDRWRELQRIDKPSRGRFPRPDGTLEYHEPVSRKSYRRAPETLAPGTGEQGNRGTGEQGKNTCASTAVERGSNAATIDADFDAWYSRYPRKKGRGQALKAYRAARKKTDAATLETALRDQTPALVANGPDKVPYPATWLNGERWLDEPDGPPRPRESAAAGWLRLATELQDDTRQIGAAR